MQGNIAHRQGVGSVRHFHLHRCFHILRIYAGNFNIVHSILADRGIFHTVNRKAAVFRAAGKIVTHSSLGGKTHRCSVEFNIRHTAAKLYPRHFLGNGVLRLDLIARIGKLVLTMAKVFLRPGTVIQKLPAQLLGLLTEAAIQQCGQIITDAVGFLQNLHFTHPDGQGNILCHLSGCQFCRDAILTVTDKGQILQPIGIYPVCIGKCSNGMFGKIIIDIALKLKCQIIPQKHLLCQIG